MSQLLQQTPQWVWAVLVVLIAYGWSLSRARQMSRARVLIVPLVMTLLSVSSVAQAFGGSGSACAAYAAWGAGALLAAAVNELWLEQPRGLRFENGLLTVPGSWAPLVLMLLIFCTKYVITASLATGWRSPDDLSFQLVGSALLGLGAGSFASRAARMWRRCI